MQTTRPFGDASGNTSESLYRGRAEGQQASPITAQPDIILRGDPYHHPFEIQIANGQVKVWQGWVYSNKGNNTYAKNQSKLNATNLGNPFLAETMPSIAVQNGLLWLKVEFVSGEVSAITVLYATTGTAKDDANTRWVEIGETATTGLIKQRLKSDVFIATVSDPGHYWKITKSGDDQVDIANGVVNTPVISHIDYGSAQFAINGQVLQETPVTSGGLTGLSDGDLIILQVAWSSFTFTTFGGIGYVIYTADTFTVASVAAPLPVSDPFNSYHTLGIIHMTAGVITSIEQKIREPITLPSITFLDG